MRERAVRLVLDNQSRHGSRWQAVLSISSKIGCAPQTLLDWVQPTLDSALLYVSDHGESLGENGLFLHAAPYSIAPESQTHVPMLMWFSPDAYKNWGISKDCMKAKLDDPELSHDNIFHSLLGLFDVQSSVYQSGLDMFSSCRPAN